MFDTFSRINDLFIVCSKRRHLEAEVLNKLELTYYRRNFLKCFLFILMIMPVYFGHKQKS